LVGVNHERWIAVYHPSEASRSYIKANSDEAFNNVLQYKENFSDDYYTDSGKDVPEDGYLERDVPFIKEWAAEKTYQAFGPDGYIQIGLSNGYIQEFELCGKKWLIVGGSSNSYDYFYEEYDLFSFWEELFPHNLWK
jgi:hypothetical protein